MTKIKWIQKCELAIFESEHVSREFKETKIKGDISIVSITSTMVSQGKEYVNMKFDDGFTRGVPRSAFQTVIES